MTGKSNTIESMQLVPDDFTSGQEPRWCPGCGNYSILAQMKKVLPELGIPKEEFVFVSGIGCSGRFPYYLDTYGVHCIHGRAPAFATGIKLAAPHLKVFIITGDGDGLSIGGNHFIHLCRRNVDVTLILFNNRVYGLTKGQYSPTSKKGQITSSSPYGSIDNPFNPVRMALAAGASFVARTIDRLPKHLAAILKRAAEHKGTSVVEVYQNCNIFNDGAYSDLTDPEQREDNVLLLKDKKPYIFGKNSDKVLDWTGNDFKVVNISGNKKQKELITHDESAGHPAMEFMLASLSEDPCVPTPIGVFRDIKNAIYEDVLKKQIDSLKKKKGENNLEQLLNSGNTWIVE